MDISIINQDIYNFNKANSNIEALKNSARLADSTEDKELKEACQGFEAIFLKSMLKNMRDSLPGNALFETDNHGMDIYKSMYDEYLAENLSKQGNGLGISEFLYNELRDKTQDQ
ncbi:MAG: rod-binding protein [Desulfobacteraceae bacterium]|nr:rod-binding protein [Desulfobacteraceae bacterium]